MPICNAWNDEAFRAVAERTTELGPTGPITLSHFDYPYIRLFPDVHGEAGVADGQNLVQALRDGVQDSLWDYVGKVQRVLLGDDGVGIDLFRPSDGLFRIFANEMQLAWLPPDNDPYQSSWVVRTEWRPSADGQPPVETLLDMSLALFAVQVWDRSAPATAFRNGLGVRVDAAIRVEAGAGASIRFDGISLSAGLLQAISRPQSPGLPLARLRAYATSNGIGDFRDFGALLAPLVADATGFAPELVVVDGIGVEPVQPDSPWVQVYAHAMRPPPPSQAPAHAITALVDFGVCPPSVVSAHATQLVAHANARLFAFDGGAMPSARELADPASQAGLDNIESARPNRAAPEFEPFRHPIGLPGLGAGPVPLLGPRNWFAVMQSRLVDPAGNEAAVQQADGADSRMHARQNAFAAVSGYRQACDLLAKIDGYGLSPHHLFRFLPGPSASNPPIRMRHRSAMTRGIGRDGRTVNASVDFEPPSNGIGANGNSGAQAPDPRKPIQIRLALADLQRSWSRREPLGIAADPRWSWHEFGHLLLAGSTGKLEFAFAHSAGDALAAIVNDPASTLAGDHRQSAMRGVTFPWVYLHRRHDRAVEDGWGWSGTYHRALQFDLSNSNSRHKGYASEQILSTTLFRLYRALGGDTVDANGTPDAQVRQSASDYTIYLIMRAIASIGSACAVNLQVVSQFACALQHADRVTRRGATGSLLAGRVGGCAHKVVRWAFERQGLYSGVPPNQVHNGVGQPPTVDVFIDDLRGSVVPDHEPGAYSPVSLASDRDSLAAMAWLASGQGMKIQPAVAGSDVLTVMVGNRGSQPAQSVVVSAWWIRWPANVPAMPDWNRNVWTAMTPASSGPTTIDPGQTRAFGPFTGLPAATGQYLVMAECHAVGDRANTYVDPMFPTPPFWGDDLPCAHGDTRLVDLIAGDNNLGLIVYSVT